jgi:hypothetical protein
LSVSFDAFSVPETRAVDASFFLEASRAVPGASLSLIVLVWPAVSE